MIIKKIAIMTSGGDSHGMNNAIRAIALSAINQKIDVYLVYEAYKGLVEDKIALAKKEDFRNITNIPGTFIQTLRLPEFSQKKLQNAAIKNLQKHNIDVLFIIGGNGSYKGAYALSKSKIKVITLPGTIDNDVFSSQYNIGFDSCLNKIVDAIDNIKDTAMSHKRIHIIETMGRYCGDLALYAGIATGADLISTPEKKLTYKQIKNKLKKGIISKKTYQIFVTTESLYDINALAKKLEKDLGKKVKPTIIGSVQRGGKQSAKDRVLATMMGSYALDQAIKGRKNIAIAYNKSKFLNIKLEKAIKAKKDTKMTFEINKMFRKLV